MHVHKDIAMRTSRGTPADRSDEEVFYPVITGWLTVCVWHSDVSDLVIEGTTGGRNLARHRLRMHYTQLLGSFVQLN